MKVNIRRAKQADLDEIQQLFINTIQSTCKNDYQPEQIAAWTLAANDLEMWTDFLNDQYFLVAEVKQKIVGFASLKNKNHVDLMYVGKDYLRKGIATKLLGVLKKESTRLGFSKLTSDVSQTALAFFKANDFDVIRKNKNFRNGIEIINYHMSQS